MKSNDLTEEQVIHKLLFMESNTCIYGMARDLLHVLKYDINKLDIFELFQDSYNDKARFSEDSQIYTSRYEIYPKLRGLEDINLSDDPNYFFVEGFSSEMIDEFMRVQPHYELTDIVANRLSLTKRIARIVSKPEFGFDSISIDLILHLRKNTLIIRNKFKKEQLFQIIFNDLSQKDRYKDILRPNLDVYTSSDPLFLKVCHMSGLPLEDTESSSEYNSFDIRYESIRDDMKRSYLYLEKELFNEFMDILCMISIEKLIAKAGGNLEVNV